MEEKIGRAMEIGLLLGEAPPWVRPFDRATVHARDWAAARGLVRRDADRIHLAYVPACPSTAGRI